MEQSLARLNTTALATFSKILDLANKAQDEQAFHEAAWFDTPEKRLQWWFDLEPQWRQAFNEAVFMRKEPKKSKKYTPKDKELVYLMHELTMLDMCGAGDYFGFRNNNPDISFQLTNLSGVANLTNLTRLEVDYNGLIESLEPLKNLKNLETLWCDNNQISDLSPLMGLHKLTDICCWNNQIRNLEPLASMIQIESLALGYVDSGNPIEDPSPIQYLLNLYSLQMGSCGLTDLAFLNNCTKLRYLEIRGNDIDPDIKAAFEERMYGFDDY
jgi:Leucine Rich repeats (2 copies)